jgi:hypothetical protein
MLFMNPEFAVDCRLRLAPIPAEAHDAWQFQPRRAAASIRPEP